MICHAERRFHKKRQGGGEEGEANEEGLSLYMSRLFMDHLNFDLAFWVQLASNDKVYYLGQTTARSVD